MLINDRARLAGTVVVDGRLRRRVLDVYARVAADWRSAPSTLAEELRNTRDLHSRERRFLGEAIYALVRWRRRLAFVARGADDAPPMVLLLTWLAGQIPEAAALPVELERAGIDPMRVATGDARIQLILDPTVRLGVQHSYPDWLVRRFLDEYSEEEAGQLLGAMNRRAPLTVRANRLKTDREGLQQALLEEGVQARAIALAPDALELDTHLNVYALQAFRRGLFEVQDAGSQLIAELVAPPPRGVVIDACAGAGGKTLALGALLENRGRLVAFDVSWRKLAELKERARRAGLSNVEARFYDARNVGRVPPADRVLTDVPCSGLGVLRRHPEARWRLQPADLDELPPKQRAILETYAPLVAVGGRLIYATCTVTRAENDDVIDRFVAEQPLPGMQFEEVSAKEILGSARAAEIGDGKRLRVLPHRHDSDGFFAAVLRRRS